MINLMKTKDKEFMTPRIKYFVLTPVLASMPADDPGKVALILAIPLAANPSGGASLTLPSSPRASSEDGRPKNKLPSSFRDGFEDGSSVRCRIRSGMK